MVCKGNAVGVQFLPERSGPSGLQFLQETLEQCMQRATVEHRSNSVSIVQLEDFGQLQALPVTISACRVVAVVNSAEQAASCYTDGADEVRYSYSCCLHGCNTRLSFIFFSFICIFVISVFIVFSFFCIYLLFRFSFV